MFANDKKYYVVEWPPEDSGSSAGVSIVPCTWITTDENMGIVAFWPADQYKSQHDFDEAIKSAAPLNGEFKAFPVKIWYRTDNYFKAKSRYDHVVRNESFSTSEDENQRKRKIKKNPKYSTQDFFLSASTSRNRMSAIVESGLDDSDDGETLPEIDRVLAKPVSTKYKIPSMKTIVSKSILAQKSAESAKSNKTIVSKSILELRDGQSEPDNQLRSTTLYTPQPVKTTLSKNILKEKSSGSESEIEIEPKKNQTKQKKPESDKKRLVEPVGTFHELLETVKRIEKAVNNNTTKLVLLQQDLNDQKKILHNEALTFEHEDMFGLPIGSVTDLEKLDNNLKDAEHFSKMCSVLVKLGGKDGADTTKRVLKKLLSHELALSINWSGRQDKKAFKQFTNVISLIVAVVRKNSFSTSTTHSEVESIVKIWLRNAPDRMGGREKRRPKKDAPEEKGDR